MANKKYECADCKKEAECVLKLKNVHTLVKMLKKIKEPIMVLPTDYHTATESDICYGVGVGLLNVVVKNGDLYMLLPEKPSSETETLRRQYVCKIHHEKIALTKNMQDSNAD